MTYILRSRFGADLHQCETHSLLCVLYSALHAGVILRDLELQTVEAVNLYAPGIDLRGAHFAAVNLHGSTLRGADLRGCTFIGVDFSATDLRGADLRGAVFYRCNWVQCDLRGTELFELKLNHADLSGAILT